jgi:hypothetical protein
MDDQKDVASAGADARAPWTPPVVSRFPMAVHTQSAKSKTVAAALANDDFFVSS